MIYVTFVGGGVRGKRRAYDTDKAGEALVEAASKWYGDSAEYPRERAVFAVVVERDDVELTRAEVIELLDEIVAMERDRAFREATGG